ncbi:MAG: sulfurtransferase-like selenium metabolism protein YedF [Spirochaetaceae bacterium]|jgi:selenium metabolism protein YedF|nr:sulfurtransferase-like selenium metabolism protein YedF [Spirochaetaceae bacterium]
MKTLDMLGQPCPIPVVKAKEALAQEASVVVLVDNLTAVQNLEKMAKGTGCGFSYASEGASYRVRIVKDPDAGELSCAQEDSPADKAPASETRNRGPVVLISAETLGRGSEDLGRILIKGFVFSLTQLQPLPEAVLFINGGAQLTTEGATTVPDLKTLEAKGVGIHTCGTCANYYQLTSALAVGTIVDMLHIVNCLAHASTVITV